MGCDIYVVIESSANGEEWELDKKPPFSPFEYSDESPLNGAIFLGRDRNLFWILSGCFGVPFYPIRQNGLERAINKIRGINTEIPHQSRGLPANASKEVAEHWKQIIEEIKAILELQDYNNVEHISWLNFKEIHWILKKHRENKGWWYGWSKVLKRMERIEKEGRKSRIVFWFSY